MKKDYVAEIGAVFTKFRSEDYLKEWSYLQFMASTFVKSIL
jgi:hypothetical protein